MPDVVVLRALFEGNDAALERTALHVEATMDRVAKHAADAARQGAQAANAAVAQAVKQQQAAVSRVAPIAAAGGGGIRPPTVPAAAAGAAGPSFNGQAITAALSAAQAGIGSFLSALGRIPGIAAAAFAKVVEGVRMVERTFADVSQRTGRLGTALTLGITLPTLAVGASGLKAAGDFEKGLNLIQTNLRLTAPQLELVRKKAFELGNDMQLPRVSAEGAAQAMLLLSKSGLTLNQVLGSTRAVLLLTTAAHISQEQAVKTVSGALQVYHLEASRAVDISNLLVGASQRTNSEASEFARGLGAVGSIANLANQSIEDTVTALAIQAKHMVYGEKAGTAYKVMLQRLMAPTDEGLKILQKYNIQLYDAQGHFMALPAIAEQFANTIGKVSESQRNFDMTKLFGQRAAPFAAIPLLLESGGAAGFERTKKGIVEAHQAEAVATAATKGWNGAVDQLVSSLETLRLKVIMPMLPVLTNFANSVTRLLIQFINAPASTRNFALQIVAIAAAVGPVLLIFSKLSAAIPLLIGTFFTFGGLLSLVFTGASVLIAGFAVAWVKHHGGMAKASEELGKKLAPVLKFITAEFTKLVAWFDANLPRFEAALTRVGAVMGPLLQAALARARTVVQVGMDLLAGNWQKAWADLRAAVGPALAQAGALAVKVFSDLRKGLEPIAKEVIPFVVTQFNKIRAWFVENMPLIQATVKKALDLLEAAWNRIGPVIIAALQLAWAVIKPIIGGIVDLVLGVVKMLMQIFTGDWKGAFDTAAETVKKVFIHIGELIVEAGPKLVKYWFELGKMILGGLLDGIKANFTAVIGAVTGLGAAIIDAIKGVLGIHSPSTVMAAHGRDIAAGLAKGITDGSGVALAAARTLADGVSGAIFQPTAAMLAFLKSSLADANAHGGFTSGNSPLARPLIEHGLMEGIVGSNRPGPSEGEIERAAADASIRATRALMAAEDAIRTQASRAGEAASKGLAVGIAASTPAAVFAVQSLTDAVMDATERARDAQEAAESRSRATPHGLNAAWGMGRDFLQSGLSSQLNASLDQQVTRMQASALGLHAAIVHAMVTVNNDMVNMAVSAHDAATGPNSLAGAVSQSFSDALFATKRGANLLAIAMRAAADPNGEVAKEVKRQNEEAWRNFARYAPDEKSMAGYAKYHPGIERPEGLVAGADKSGGSGGDAFQRWVAQQNAATSAAAAAATKAAGEARGAAQQAALQGATAAARVNAKAAGDAAKDAAKLAGIDPTQAGAAAAAAGAAAQARAAVQVAATAERQARQTAAAQVAADKRAAKAADHAIEQAARAADRAAATAAHAAQRAADKVAQEQARGDLKGHHAQLAVDTAKAAQALQAANKAAADAAGKRAAADALAMGKPLADAGVKMVATAAGITTKMTAEAGKTAASFTQGLANGINAHQGEVAAAVTRLANAMVAALRASLKVRSPSEVMHALGRDVGAGFALGISSMSSAVEKAASGLGNRAMSGTRGGMMQPAFAGAGAGAGMGGGGATHVTIVNQIHTPSARGMERSAGQMANQMGRQIAHAQRSRGGR